MIVRNPTCVSTKAGQDQGAGAVTNKLNAVYAEESAKLEPALAHAQLSRLADESW